LQLRHW